MTNTLNSYKSKGDMYAHSLGYLFEEKDWINIKRALILYTNTVIDLEEKLSEQAEQEPVGWYKPSDFVLYRTKPDDVFVYAPLYAAPVRTKDLTDDEIGKLICQNSYMEDSYTHAEAFARTVIAADREKNR